MVTNVVGTEISVKVGDKIRLLENGTYIKLAKVNKAGNTVTRAGFRDAKEVGSLFEVVEVEGEIRGPRGITLNYAALIKEVGGGAVPLYGRGTTYAVLSKKELSYFLPCRVPVTKKREGWT